MDMVSILVGAGAGAVVGVIIGVVALGKGKELEATKAELAKFRRETTEQLDQLKKSEQALKKGLDAAVAKTEKTETEVAKKAKELSSVQTKLKETESARETAKKEAKAIAADRDRAQGRAEQAEKLAGEATGRAAQLENELGSAHAQLTEREEQLAAARAAGGGISLEEAVARFSAAGGSLDEILGMLVTEQNQQSAVLADSNGIVVAAAGDKSLRDGVAAVAQMMTRLGTQFEGMIPFSVVRGFDLRDAEDMVIAGRAAVLSGEVVAVATFGSQPPDGSTLDGAITSLTAALS